MVPNSEINQITTNLYLLLKGFNLPSLVEENLENSMRLHPCLLCLYKDFH
nr:MAG TPA: hypothetical protein [Caudoviricetes sp.]